MVWEVVEEVHGLVHAIAGLIKSSRGIATKYDLVMVRDEIMSAISVFAERQNAFNGRVDQAVEGLVADVAALKAQIAELQSTPGTVTPEDQALLDGIEVRTAAIAVKLEALDALTPPVVPQPVV